MGCSCRRRSQVYRVRANICVASIARKPNSATWCFRRERYRYRAESGGRHRGIRRGLEQDTSFEESPLNPPLPPSVVAKANLNVCRGTRCLRYLGLVSLLFARMRCGPYVLVLSDVFLPSVFLAHGTHFGFAGGLFSFVLWHW